MSQQSLVEFSLLRYYAMRLVPSPSSLRIGGLDIALPEELDFLFVPVGEELVTLQRDVYHSSGGTVTIVWHGCSSGGTILYAIGGSTYAKPIEASRHG